MNKAALGFAAFSLVASAVPPLQASSDETERVSQTFRLNPGGTLRLKSFSGRVNITARDTDEVTVNAVRRAARERLDRIKLEIRHDEDGVYIEANKRVPSSWAGRNNVVETDFDITVPRRTNVDVKVFSATVTVDGVQGRYDVGGFSSRIALVNVTGPVKAHTFSGPVEIQARNWARAQEIDVDTFSGDITLRVPDGAAGLVSFRSFSGSIDSEIPLTFKSGRRTRLEASLGAEADGGSLRFKTFSGNVRIDR